MFGNLKYTFFFLLLNLTNSALARGCVIVLDGTTVCVPSYVGGVYVVYTELTG